MPPYDWDSNEEEVIVDPKKAKLYMDKITNANLADALQHAGAATIAAVIAATPQMDKALTKAANHLKPLLGKKDIRSVAPPMNPVKLRQPSKKMTFADLPALENPPWQRLGLGEGGQCCPTGAQLKSGPVTQTVNVNTRQAAGSKRQARKRKTKLGMTGKKKYRVKKARRKTASKRKYTTRTRTKLRNLSKRPPQPGIATILYLYRQMSHFDWIAGDSSYQSIADFSWTQLAQTLDSVPYFTPATPDTINTMDLHRATPTQQTVWFSKVKHFYRMTNIMNYPVFIEIFVCRPRMKTNHSPLDTINFGLAAISSTMTNGDPQLTPEIVVNFNRYWKVVLKKRKRLMPGRAMVFTTSGSNIRWDTSFEEENQQVYQPNLRSYGVLMRFRGSILRDAGALPVNTFNYGSGRIIVETYRRITLKYDGGMEFYRVVSSNSGFSSLAANPVKVLNDTLTAQTVVY